MIGLIFEATIIHFLTTWKSFDTKHKLLITVSHSTWLIELKNIYDIFQILNWLNFDVRKVLYSMSGCLVTSQDISLFKKISFFIKFLIIFKQNFCYWNDNLLCFQPKISICVHVCVCVYRNQSPLYSLTAVSSKSLNSEVILGHLILILSD